jgi:ubiquinone/menaquinone biosynthesis C-methylase UbiE
MMDNIKYYEKFDWQSAELSTKLIYKIEKLISVIPSDVKTILDVGCGDGTISVGLNEKFNVIASDRSINALKQFNINRVCSSADSVSIKPNSVDLVFSSEMIEHLPDDIFYKSIEEFKRVSKKYIFLTFPNNENIEKLNTQCPECKFIFNKSYHLRTLNSEIIKELFADYKIINQFEIGKPIRHYSKILSKVKHKLSPPISWIPKYWMKEDEAIRKTMCPNCGNSFIIPYKFNLISAGCDMLNILFSKKLPYQLCILLEKK